MRKDLAIACCINYNSTNGEEKKRYWTIWTPLPIPGSEALKKYFKILWERRRE